MLMSHSGKFQLQCWTNNPDFPELTGGKEFLTRGGLVQLSTAPSLTKVLSSVRFIREYAKDHIRLVIPKLNNSFIIYTTHQAPHGKEDDMTLCWVTFTSNGLRVERKEFAPPVKDKRDSVEIFRSVLELTRL